MKLSFSTLGCPDWTFEQILDHAESMGFQGIEIRGIEGKLLAEEVAQFMPDRLDETKAKLAAHHVEIFSFGTSAFFHDSDGMEKSMEEARRAIVVCARAGIPAIRVFGDAIASAEKAHETVTRVAHCLNELCDYARAYGVKVLLEIHGQFNTVETIECVLEHCKKNENFGLIWDIAHSDVAYGRNWRPFYALIKPYIHHVHIKDHVHLPDGNVALRLVGEGEIPLEEIIRTMELDGYAGYYSLEWEKKWFPELEEPEAAFPAYCDWMKKLQTESKGE